jgi:hypothetical protein
MVAGAKSKHFEGLGLAAEFGYNRPERERRR